MVRKEFVKTCAFACIGGAALSTLLHSCASANYFAQITVANSMVSIKRTEFITMVKDKPVKRKYILVKPDSFDFPICVYKIDDETYPALLMRCTHNGCELKPQEDFLMCPCHGSEFSNTGVVLNPPAEENLKIFKTSSDNENIYIYL